MKLQMKREALHKLNRHANELGSRSDTALAKESGFDTVLIQFRGVTPSAETICDCHTCHSVIFATQTAPSSLK
jgi:hypothetical protein